MTDQEILIQLNKIMPKERVLTKESMRKHTTFRVGGEASFFVMPSTEKELLECIAFSRAEKIPFFLHGNGSNVLVSDEGISGIVIHLGECFSTITVSGTQITAQAGALLSAVAKKACRESLTGLEFAAGIPGSLGGAVVMNAGAYDGEMKQVISTVRILDEAGQVQVLSKEEMHFAYRHSLAKEREIVILEATMELTHGDESAIAARMEELSKRRKEKQPLEYPSAGSTFKRPEGFFAGKLIMDAGLSGFQVGGAMVSPKHCGFVVNAGDATAADICSLIEVVKEKVKREFGVELEPEVIFLGF